MSSRNARSVLAKRTRELTVAWQQTRESWRDGRSREFEKKFLAPLAEAVNLSSATLSELDQILTRIRNDCE